LTTVSRARQDLHCTYCIGSRVRGNAMHAGIPLDRQPIQCTPAIPRHAGLTRDSFSRWGHKTGSSLAVLVCRRFYRSVNNEFFNSQIEVSKFLPRLEMSIEFFYKTEYYGTLKFFAHPCSFVHVYTYIPNGKSEGWLCMIEKLFSHKTSNTCM
jgi:hypothetical protein